MSGPEQIWSLNIILASVLLLLVRCIGSMEIGNNGGSTTPQPMKSNNNHNYEVIDVAHHDGDNHLQVQTGQTTRILTSGEVDDNFWLKHLGEDFKYAIHLQVGEDPYNGIYNMTENGFNYNVKHDYHINNIPVEGDRSKTQQEPKGRQENYANSEIRNMNYPTNTEEGSASYRNINSTAGPTKQEIKSYDDFYTLSENGMPLFKRHFKRNENQKTQTTEYTKPKKTQNINIRFTHKQHESQQHQQEDTNSTSNQENKESIIKTSPIVITLPNTDNTIQHLADEDAPVVVKMPPVIYHQGPTYAEYSSNEQTNQTTHPQHSEQIMPTHNQYTSHQNQKSLQYEDTDFTQYTQHSLHLTPMAPMPPQGSLPYYNTAVLNEQRVYHNNDNYGSSPATGPNSIQQLQKPPGPIHFILRKRSTPYNEQATHNQMSLEEVF